MWNFQIARIQTTQYHYDGHGRYDANKQPQEKLGTVIVGTADNTEQVNQAESSTDKYHEKYTDLQVSPSFTRQCADMHGGNRYIHIDEKQDKTSKHI